MCPMEVRKQEVKVIYFYRNHTWSLSHFKFALIFNFLLKCLKPSFPGDVICIFVFSSFSRFQMNIYPRKNLIPSMSTLFQNQSLQTKSSQCEEMHYRSIALHLNFGIISAIHSMIQSSLIQGMFCRKALGKKIIGCPSCIDGPKYARNALIFNLCMVVDEYVNTLKYENVIRKLAACFRTLEVRFNLWYS